MWNYYSCRSLSHPREAVDPVTHAIAKSATGSFSSTGSPQSRKTVRALTQLTLTPYSQSHVSFFHKEITAFNTELPMKIHTAFGLVGCLTLAACVTSHVIVGKVRPPISPDQVQLYLHPPGTPYEEVALLESSSKNSFSFTAQGKTNAVIMRMKEDAAKLGANGILLDGVGDKAAGSVGTGFGTATGAGHSVVGVGFGTSGTVFVKSGKGLAIYVPPTG